MSSLPVPERPLRPVARWLNLLRHFVVRDIRQRYLGSLWGGLWALLQPLLLFGIYALVFVQILRVRLPATVAGDFVPFLVAGLWPWTAFAEALNRASNAIPEHAGLLAKVAMPRAVLVVAPVTASFALHGAGFVAVIAAVAAMGREWHPAGIPAALVLFLLLYGFALGLACALAAIQVFVRDLSHVLAQAITLWFFLTPVFYTREMVPPAFARVLDLNPVTVYVDGIRAALATGAQPDATSLLLAVATTAVACALGAFVFRRLSKHFEDFL
jgi:ABC-type polysaccharide/polyol phosphate export permease